MIIHESWTPYIFGICILVIIGIILIKFSCRTKIKAVLVRIETVHNTSKRYNINAGTLIFGYNYNGKFYESRCLEYMDAYQAKKFEVGKEYDIMISKVVHKYCVFKPAIAKHEIIILLFSVLGLVLYMI